MFSACVDPDDAKIPKPLHAKPRSIEELTTGDPEIDRQIRASVDYWLNPVLPDDNVMLAQNHWLLVSIILPAYARFIQLSCHVNKHLKSEYDVSTYSSALCCAAL